MTVLCCSGGDCLVSYLAVCNNFLTGDLPTWTTALIALTRYYVFETCQTLILPCSASLANGCDSQTASRSCECVISGMTQTLSPWLPSQTCVDTVSMWCQHH